MKGLLGKLKNRLKGSVHGKKIKNREMDFKVKKLLQKKINFVETKNKNEINFQKTHYIKYIKYIKLLINNNNNSNVNFM
jgi:hypothetical protein